jgi:hypothetical protein
MMLLAVAVELRYENSRFATICTWNLNYGCTQEENLEITPQYASFAPRIGRRRKC